MSTFGEGIGDGDGCAQGPSRSAKPVEPGRIPRISRLMALAIHFDGLIRKGIVRDYVDIARLGGVSKARVSQIMDLLNLAPEIQEEILFLPRVTGRDEVTERLFRPVVAAVDWEVQRRLLSGRLSAPVSVIQTRRPTEELRPSQNEQMFV